MESALSKGCTIKIQNFEGPFDLLFHLFEKNKVDIYDIPISEIADQYMDYLFAMQTLDLEIASEFLVIAATLLHLKSRMLLPEKKEIRDEEIDPREELVLKLIAYKKVKRFSAELRKREEQWTNVFYKPPEVIEVPRKEWIHDLNYEELINSYASLLRRNVEKLNKGATKITQIIQHEKVSLKAKIREVMRNLISKSSLKFSKLFSFSQKSSIEVVTGFLAILELAKTKKVGLEQKKVFSEIIIKKL